MSRTTAAAVQDVLGRDYDSGNANRPARSLTPYIATANLLTSRLATAASARGVALTSPEAELVERWLAAHFYACSDKPYAENWTDTSKAVFSGKTGMYLEATLYGQQAIVCDPSGLLAAMAQGARRTANASWLGRPRSEQTPWWQRD